MTHYLLDQHVVQLKGEGLLHAKIAHRLAEVALAIRNTPTCTASAEPVLELLVADTPDPDRFEVAARSARARGVAFLPAWIEFGHGRWGPCCGPSGLGCLHCSEARRIECHPHQRLHRQAMVAVAGKATPAVAKALPFLDVLAMLVANEAATAVAVPAATEAGESPPLAEFGMLNLRRGELERHRFLALPTCPVCGHGELAPRTDFDAAAAGIAMPLRASVPAAQSGWRLRDFAGWLPELEQCYVDRGAGLVTHLGVDLENPLVATGAGRFPMGDHGDEQWSAGTSTRFDHGQATAILETLERYAGLRPRAVRSLLRASTSAIGDAGLDLRELTLYDEAQYERPGFLCRRFDPDITISWVEGHSFGRRGQLMVPAQAVWYDALFHPGDERFVLETSSGCAIGGCLEEAIAHGLLETLERDAVLRTWFARLRPRRFDLASVRDPETRLLLDRLMLHRAYQIHALDVTQEFGIPTVWVVVESTAPDLAASYSSSKCHPDPEVAFRGALCEVLASLPFHEVQCRKRRAELLPMLADPGRIRDQFDHTEVAGLHEARDRLLFLWESDSESVSFQDSRWDEPRSWRGDVGRLLSRTVEAVLGNGFDVVAVDQTSPEEGHAGTRTAKVLIPGLLPMYFGGNYQRTAGSPRLGGLAEVNPYPHPFP
jgi:ribosomal protein S12 methylthiotransferase accessory factor